MLSDSSSRAGITVGVMNGSSWAWTIKAGVRTAETSRFQPEPDSLILLDTLHGLYGGLTESVPDSHKFKIYIETIAQLKDAEGDYLRWADVRLLRRMIRLETKDQIDAYFAQVEKAIGKDAAKRQAMVQGFTRILKATTYGTDEARKRAQAFCDEHGKAKRSRRGRD